MVTRIINFIFVYGFNNHDKSSLTNSITKVVTETTKHVSNDINYMGSLVKDDINSMLGANQTQK